jgi:hypothetical protein
MRTVLRLGWSILTASFLLLPLASAAAAQEDPLVEVTVFPQTVAPSGEIVEFRVEVVVPSAQQPATVTGLSSDLYGDITDPANPAIDSTTCSAPVAYVPTPGWVGMACSFQVFISGDPGEVANTVSATVLLADSTEVTVADTVVVTVSADVGTISGTLVDEDTGEPIPDIFVWGFSELESFGGFTGPDGTFTFIGLGSGEYRLQSGSVRPGGKDPEAPAGYRTEYAYEMYDDDSAGLPSQGDLITLSPGGTVDITWELSVGGSIEGSVTSTDGAPITEFTVVYWMASEDGSPSPRDVGGNGGGFSSSSSDGTYRLWGLRAGTYYVCFETAYGAGCWDDRETSSPINSPRSGDPITVTLGQATTGVNVQFSTGNGNGGNGDGEGEPLPFTGVDGIAAVLAGLALITTGAGVVLVTGRMASRI